MKNPKLSSPHQPSPASAEEQCARYDEREQRHLVDNVVTGFEYKMTIYVLHVRQRAMLDRNALDGREGTHAHLATSCSLLLLWLHHHITSLLWKQNTGRFHLANKCTVLLSIEGISTKTAQPDYFMITIFTRGFGKKKDEIIHSIVNLLKGNPFTERG